MLILCLYPRSFRDLESCSYFLGLSKSHLDFKHHLRKPQTLRGRLLRVLCSGWRAHSLLVSSVSLADKLVWPKIARSSYMDGVSLRACPPPPQSSAGTGNESGSRRGGAAGLTCGSARGVQIQGRTQHGCQQHIQVHCFPLGDHGLAIHLEGREHTGGGAPRESRHPVMSSGH